MTLGAFSTYIQRDEKLQATLNVLRHHEQE